MSEHPSREHPPYDDVPMLETDETIPPRPEEEVADVARAEPDPGVEREGTAGAV
jgi:hypothetical protein